MKNTKKQIGIPWEEAEKELTKDFTPEDWQYVEEEIKRYDLLVSLYNARKQANLTQAQLAEKANIPRSTVSKVESGTYNPTIKTLQALARALGKELVVRFE